MSSIEEQIQEHLGIVRFVLNNFFPKLAQDDDVYQLALIGLWNACRTYRPERGAFSTYAVSCCRHEVCKELRKHKRRPQLISLEDETKEGLTVAGLIADPVDHFGSVDLRNAWNRLTEREKRILGMRASGYSQQEIGKLLGVSQSRICRIINRRKMELMSAV